MFLEVKKLFDLKVNQGYVLEFSMELKPRPELSLYLRLWDSTGLKPPGTAKFEPPTWSETRAIFVLFLFKVICLLWNGLLTHGNRPTQTKNNTNYKRPTENKNKSLGILRSSPSASFRSISSLTDRYLARLMQRFGYTVSLPASQCVLCVLVTQALMQTMGRVKEREKMFLESYIWKLTKNLTFASSH